MPTPERAPDDPALARLLDALCTAVEGYGMEDWRDYPEVPPARAAVEAYLDEHYRRKRPPPPVVEVWDADTFERFETGETLRWDAARQMWVGEEHADG